MFACTNSHLRCLELAKQREWPWVFVMEDDFTFLVDKPTLWALLQPVLEGAIDFDVIMLSYGNHGPQGEAPPGARALGLGHVFNSQTSSGYIVHSGFYDTLMSNFRESLETRSPLDMFWKKLQPISRWYYTLQRMGKQRLSFSDIEKRTVDYGC
jgi:hypothetical protein